MVEILLREVRIKKNMSTRALAELAGVSRSHIIKIESGQSMPGIDVLCNLADALDVQIEELYRHKRKSKENS